MLDFFKWIASDPKNIFLLVIIDLIIGQLIKKLVKIEGDNKLNELFENLSKKPLLTIIGVIFIMALREEVIFRFIVLNLLLLILKSQELAIWVGALIFALAHIINFENKKKSPKSLFLVAPQLFAGLVFSIVFIESGRGAEALFVSTCWHTLHNLIILMPFLLVLKLEKTIGEK